MPYTTLPPSVKHIVPSPVQRMVSTFMVIIVFNPGMLELVFWFLKFTAFVKLTENTIVHTSPQITAINFVLLFIILKFKLILNSNSHYKCTIIFYTRKIYNKRITYLIFWGLVKIHLNYLWNSLIADQRCVGEGRRWCYLC